MDSNKETANILNAEAREVSRSLPFGFGPVPVTLSEDSNRDDLVAWLNWEFPIGHAEDLSLSGCWDALTVVAKDAIR